MPSRLKFLLAAGASALAICAATPADATVYNTPGSYEFFAPVAGWYEIIMSGAQGGDSGFATGGLGFTVGVEIYFPAGWGTNFGVGGRGQPGARFAGDQNGVGGGGGGGATYMESGGLIVSYAGGGGGAGGTGNLTAYGTQAAGRNARGFGFPVSSGAGGSATFFNSGGAGGATSTSYGSQGGGPYGGGPSLGIRPPFNTGGTPNPNATFAGGAGGLGGGGAGGGAGGVVGQNYGYGGGGGGGGWNGGNGGGGGGGGNGYYAFGGQGGSSEFRFDQIDSGYVRNLVTYEGGTWARFNYLNGVGDGFVSIELIPAPEPATLGLFGLSLARLALTRRRRAG